MKLLFNVFKIIFNEDGTAEKLCVCKKKRRRIIIWDKTDHPYSWEIGKSEPRAKSYTDQKLPRSGGNIKRASQHTTRFHVTTTTYEVLLPLIIFDADTEKIKNHKVKHILVENSPTITGRLGLNKVLYFSSSIAGTKSGSITDTLFCGHI